MTSTLARAGHASRPLRSRPLLLTGLIAMATGCNAASVTGQPPAPRAGGAGGGVGTGGSPSAGSGPAPVMGGTGPAQPGGTGGAAGASGTGGGAPRADAGADGPSAAPPPGQPIPLPIVVTEHFTNRGWFGDATIARHFQPGSMVIREVASTTGPCAARPTGARGACLEFTYTPPPGFAPPAMGAFVGVYMLPTLRMNHPEAMPPARAGEPNWGLEPGIPVAAGARRVTFYAAAAQNGVRVSFRAGTDRDSIVLPEHTEVLTPEWKQISMNLAGGETGPNLLGGFAWTFKETGRPATFYVDGIVWDGEGTDPPAAPMGRRDNVRQVVFINQCTEDGLGGHPVEHGRARGRRLPARRAPDPRRHHPGRVVVGPLLGPHRLHLRRRHRPLRHRRLCRPARLRRHRWKDTRLAGRDHLGRLGCRAGLLRHQPGRRLQPADGHGAAARAASLRSPGAAYDCLTPTCVSDLNATCPPELRVVEGGRTVGCLSACEKLDGDEYCCKGAHDTPETCGPTSYSPHLQERLPHRLLLRVRRPHQHLHLPGRGLRDLVLSLAAG